MGQRIDPRPWLQDEAPSPEATAGADEPPPQAKPAAQPTKQVQSIPTPQQKQMPATANGHNNKTAPAEERSKPAEVATQPQQSGGDRHLAG